MKTINWNKIPNSKVVGKKNIWSRLASKFKSKPMPEPDWKHLEGLFCQQAPAPPKPSPQSPQENQKKKESNEVNLFDGRRSLTINIFLKQFKSSSLDVVELVRSGNAEDLGAEKLRGLLKILPTPDEVDVLNSYDGDPARLGGAERLMVQLIRVPSFRLRVESMLLREEFDSNYDGLKSSIVAMMYAADDLMNNENLHKVLYLTVNIGNFLNSGGYAGNAAGIKLSSLQTLVNVRANKPGMTLMHSIAEQAACRHPETLDFPAELEELELASKTTIEQIKTDAAQLQTSVTKVRNQLAASSTEQQLRQQTEAFLDQASAQLQELTKMLEQLEEYRRDLADFFCEDAATFKMESALEILWSFANMFKKAVNENDKRRHQEEEASARKRAREEQQAKRKSGVVGQRPVSLSGSETDNVADGMLASIKDSERKLEQPLTPQPHRRRRNMLDVLNTGSLTSEDEPSVANSPRMSRKNRLGSFSGTAGTPGEGPNGVLITDSPGTVRRRRSRVPSEEDDTLLDYLRSASNDNNPRERRSWGGIESYGSLDRSMARRMRGGSAVRRRPDLLSADFLTDRERPASPSLTTPTQEETEKPAAEGGRPSHDWKKKIDHWFEENDKDREQAEDLTRRRRLQSHRRVAEVANDGSKSDGGKMPVAGLGTVPEGKSLESGSSSYKRVYKDWKPSVEQKDILGAMEAIEEAHDQQPRDKSAWRKSNLNVPNSAEGTGGRGQEGPVQGSEGQTARRDLIKGLGRKVSDESIPLYVRKTSNNSQDNLDSRKNSLVHETPEGVTLKVPDVNRTHHVTAPAIPAPVTPSDQRPRRADRQESQDSTSDRLLPPSIPRRFRKLSNDEVPNKIDIDAENIETPPVTRRALGTRSFRAPPNQTWLAAPRRSEDEPPEEDFSARRQQRRFHSLRLDPAAAEERRRGLLKPAAGNADSSDNEEDGRVKLSQRYARLVELAKDAESESETTRPKAEDAPRDDEEHAEKFDRHSSVRKSTRRKREEAEPTQPSSPPPAEEGSDRRRPKSPSAERQTLKPVQDDHRGSNSDIERAITSISETADKLKKVDAPPPEKRDAHDRRSRARSMIDGGQVAEAKRRGDKEKGPSIHDRLFGRGKKDKEPTAPVKRMSSLRRRREDTDEGFAEETSGASANNEESSGRRRTRPSTLSLAGLKKPAPTGTRSPSVRDRSAPSGVSGSSTLGRARSKEPPRSTTEPARGLGRSQSVRASGPARPRPVLNSATSALKALTKNLRGRGRDAEPAPKPAGSLHNSSGSLCSTPSVSKRSSESSLKASPKPGRRATTRTVPPSPTPARKAAPQSTTTRRAAAANGAAAGARRSPAARVASPPTPPLRGSSSTLPRASRPAVSRVSSHEDAPPASTKPRRVATPSFMRPTSSSNARVDPAEKKKSSVSRSITLSKPRATLR